MTCLRAEVATNQWCSVKGLHKLAVHFMSLIQFAAVIDWMR